MLIRNVFDNFDDAIVYMKALRSWDMARRIYYAYCNGKCRVSVACGAGDVKEEVETLMKEIELENKLAAESRVEWL